MWESKFLKINTSIAGDTLQILGLKSLLEMLLVAILATYLIYLNWALFECGMLKFFSNHE